MAEWLKSPTVSDLPRPEHLNPLEISRVLSVVSSRSLGPVPQDFLGDCLSALTTTLSSSQVSQADTISTLHILDRIAANGVVDERTGDVIESLLENGNLKVGKTDVFIGAHAGLLLGYPELARVLVTPAQCRSLSVPNLVQLTSLAASTSDVTLKSTLHNELVKRLEGSEELHAVTSFELVSAVKSIALISVGLDNVTRTTRMLKKAGSELVRRIELRTVSPHSIVDLVETFSGQPPCPIHPMLLQACYAFLLEGNNYHSLSPDECARILHASALAEIENTVLTSLLVNRVALTPVQDSGDPRIPLRALSGISLSRAYLHPSTVRAVSCLQSFPGLQSSEDLSLLGTATANLLGNGSVCRRTIDSLLLSDNSNTCDMNLVDVANLLLIAAVPFPKTPCEIPVRIGDPSIPQSALEITEKGNPAMPRSDIKKKRLAKRAVSRAESMTRMEDMEVETKLCDCYQGGDDIRIPRNQAVKELIVKCHTLLKKGPDPSIEWKESIRACSDIIVALNFLDHWLKTTVTLSDLKTVDHVIEECMHVLSEADEPTLAFEEGVHDVESSVVMALKNIGVGAVVSPLITNSNLRFTCQVSL
jgi:hypothetical protein